MLVASFLKTLTVTTITVAGVYVAAATVATTMAGDTDAARTKPLHKSLVAGKPVFPDAALYRAHRELADAQISCFKPDQVDVIPQPKKRFLDVAMK